jgi:hypothetical protein
MNDALLVCSFERLGNLVPDGERLVDRDRTAREALREALREVLAFDQLHDERLLAIRLLEAVNLRERAGD